MYVLFDEIADKLDEWIVHYARMFPEANTQAELTDFERRQRFYGQMEGMLIAIGDDPWDEGCRDALHGDINVVRRLLAAAAEGKGCVVGEDEDGE